MNITREKIDALNAVVKIDIETADYKDKVEKVLKNYRKNANVPGFRKGQIPMGMIRKQYEKPVIIEEVNKLLQEELGKYLVDEKIDILGNPLPRTNENFSWDDDLYTFEFELGLAPEFNVDIESANDIPYYKIEVTDSLLEEETENIQKRYGKLTTLETSKDNSKLVGTFVNEEKGINKKGEFYVNKLKEDSNKEKATNVKVGDLIELNSKNLFEDDFKLSQALNIPYKEVKNLDIKLSFTVEEIQEIEPAELNEDLFNKLFTDGTVSTASELKENIKEDAEKQFEQQADKQLLNTLTDHFIENTKFDLPEDFLQKWLQTSGKNPMTVEEAKIELKRSEKGLRYQLIENKIMEDNDLKFDYNELIEYIKEFVKNQMAQFGKTDPSDKELTEIAYRIMDNKNEVERIKQQLTSEKIMDFFKSNINFKTKKVDYKQFIEEAYG